MTRRILLWSVAAILGLALAAVMTWATSRLTSQRIGLASSPSNGGLAPAVPAAPIRSQTTTVTATVTATTTVTRTKRAHGSPTPVTTTTVTSTTAAPPPVVTHTTTTPVVTHTVTTPVLTTTTRTTTISRTSTSRRRTSADDGSGGRVRPPVPPHRDD